MSEHQEEFDKYGRRIRKKNIQPEFDKYGRKVSPPGTRKRNIAIGCAVGLVAVIAGLATANQTSPQFASWVEKTFGSSSRRVASTDKSKWDALANAGDEVPAPQSPAPTPTKPVFAPTDIVKVRDTSTGSVSTFQAQNVTCKKHEIKGGDLNWDPPRRRTSYREIICSANGFIEDLAGERKVTSGSGTCSNTAYSIYYTYNDGRPEELDFSEKDNAGNNPTRIPCIAALHFGKYTPGELSK